MEQVAQVKLTKFGKVNQFIRFLTGVLIGSVIGYTAIPLIMYVLLKISPIIDKEADLQFTQKFLNARPKVTKILQGAILGSFTRTMYLPIAAILITQIVDGRIKINKKAFYLKEENLFDMESAPSLVPLCSGVIVGTVVNFTDLCVITFVAKLFGIMALFIQKFDECQSEQFKKQEQNLQQSEVRQFRTSYNYKSSIFVFNVAFGGFIGFEQASLWLFLVSGFYLLWLLASSHLIKNPKRVEQKSVIESDETYKKLSRAEEELACPISSIIMTNPIFLKQCGHTFDGKQIEVWLQKKNSCPLCNSGSDKGSMKKNVIVAKIVEDIRLPGKDE